MEARIKSLISSFEKRIILERRWGKRRSAPRLAVYYWNGGTPKPHGIRDISSSGVYVNPGTFVPWCNAPVNNAKRGSR
jgi:hypothetical protein